MAGVTLEMQRQYITAAERINKQLYRLERSVREGKTNAAILEYAYRIARTDIKRATGLKRMPTSKRGTPKTVRQWRQYMNIINRFYSMPTSGKRGIKEIYERRAETWSKKLGFDLNSNTLAKMFETGLFQDLTAKFESKTAVKMLARIAEQRDTIKEQLENGEKIQFKGNYARRLNNFFAEKDTEMLKTYLSL